MQTSILNVVFIINNFIVMNIFQHKSVNVTIFYQIKYNLSFLILCWLSDYHRIKEKLLLSLNILQNVFNYHTYQYYQLIMEQCYTFNKGNTTFLGYLKSLEEKLCVACDLIPTFMLNAIYFQEGNSELVESIKRNFHFGNILFIMYICTYKPISLFPSDFFFIYKYESTRNPHSGFCNGYKHNNVF